MADLLLVTTVCRADYELAAKRLFYMQGLGEPVKKHPLLLVNDGSLSDNEMQTLSNTHVVSGLFASVLTRKIITPSTSNDWPGNVNHAWRTTAHIVAGMYGQPFDTSNLIGWFYFEPDVIPFNKDFATVLEQYYLAAPVMQFMGGVNITTTSKGGVVRHMNGAAVYPISAQFYYEKMMLMDGLPWDVAGMADEAISRRKDIPPEIYVMGFGTRDYKRDGQKFTATQHLHDGTTKPYEFTLSSQLLHHGCKDGTLVDCLAPKSTLTQAQLKSAVAVLKKEKALVPTLSDVQKDKAAGMKWKDMMRKYKLSPSDLKKALAA